MSRTVVPPRYQNKVVIHTLMLPKTSELINLYNFVELCKSYVTYITFHVWGGIAYAVQ